MEFFIASIIGLLAGAGIVTLILRRRADRIYREGRATLESANAILAERLAARDAELSRLKIAANELKRGLDGEQARHLKLVDHARQVRDHIAKLCRKSYQEQFEPTPDLVVLFLPGEMFFSAALQHDPELIEFGVNEKVIPATPTTLIALLRAVAYGWKQEALARNAQDISDLGRELFERIATLAGHWNKVGRNLGEAVSAYNRSVGSLETRVLVSARRFKELKSVPADRSIEELTPIEIIPRALQASELNMGMPMLGVEVPALSADVLETSLP